MADVLGLSDVSTPDTGKGSQLKTGNLKRSYTMANKCKSSEVWNQKLKKCVSSPNRQKEARYQAESKQKFRKAVGGVRGEKKIKQIMKSKKPY